MLRHLWNATTDFQALIIARFQGWQYDVARAEMYKCVVCGVCVVSVCCECWYVLVCGNGCGGCGVVVVSVAGCVVLLHVCFCMSVVEWWIVVLVVVCCVKTD